MTIHDETLFCKSCYGKNFGPKGYGFGGGGAGMMSGETVPTTKIENTPTPTTVNSLPAENAPSNCAPKPAPKSRSFKENFKPGKWLFFEGITQGMVLV